MLGQWAEVGVWRALDPIVKVLAGDTVTFKQEQLKVSSVFWVAFPAHPVETGGQRQGDLLGMCDGSPRRGVLGSTTNLPPHNEGICGGWGCPSQAGRRPPGPLGGLPPADSAAVPGV